MKVLLTGATGFLGYHIARACLAAGHELLCLRRQSSRSPFTPEEEKSIRWFMLDEADVDSLVAEFAPEILVHAAWGGVEASERNDEDKQSVNLRLSECLYQLYPYRQFITIGSQDEYGYIDSEVSEDYPLNPTTAYGRAKIVCCQRQKALAESLGAEWQWVRLFGTYGTHQSSNWVIPQIIGKCLSNVPIIETTEGRQSYSFLYAEDFATAIVSMFGYEGATGIYNLASAEEVSLAVLFEMIRELTGSRSAFSPVLPYRPNQSMRVFGNTAAFVSRFGAYERHSLRQGLSELIISMQNESK